MQTPYVKILNQGILKYAEVKERIKEVVCNEQQSRREKIERSETVYKNWRKIKD